MLKVISHPQPVGVNLRDTRDGTLLVIIEGARAGEVVQTLLVRGEYWLISVGGRSLTLIGGRGGDTPAQDLPVCRLLTPEDELKLI